MAERKLINGKKDLRVKDIDGVKHKYCPRCGTYKPMTVEFLVKIKTYLLDLIRIVRIVGNL